MQLNRRQRRQPRLETCPRRAIRRGRWHSPDSDASESFRADTQGHVRALFPSFPPVCFCIVPALAGPRSWKRIRPTTAGALFPRIGARLCRTPIRGNGGPAAAGSVEGLVSNPAAGWLLDQRQPAFEEAQKKRGWSTGHSRALFESKNQAWAGSSAPAGTSSIWALFWRNSATFSLASWSYTSIRPFRFCRSCRNFLGST